MQRRAALPGAPGGSPAPWWKCAVAAAPNLFLAAQFLAAVHGKALWPAAPEWLVQVVHAEFMVIHSMMFLGMFALYKPSGVVRWVLRTVMFWTLLAVYVYMILQAGGMERLLIFLAATITTYFGVFFSWHSESARLQLGARWLVSFPLFIFAGAAFGTSSPVSSCASCRGTGPD